MFKLLRFLRDKKKAWTNSVQSEANFNEDSDEWLIPENNTAAIKCILFVRV